MNTPIDDGLNEYPKCRKAYEKAKEILGQKEPNRKELSDLLDILNTNKQGVEWLKLEHGDEYGRIEQKIRIAAGKTTAIRYGRRMLIFPAEKYIIEIDAWKGLIASAYTAERVGEIISKIRADSDARLAMLNEYGSDWGLEAGLAQEEVELIDAERTRTLRIYAEYLIEGKHKDEPERVKNSEQLVRQMVHRGVS